MNERVALRHEYQRPDLLDRVVSAASRAGDLAELMEEILHAAIEGLGFDSGMVYIVQSEPNSDEAQMMYGWDVPSEMASDLAVLKVSQPPYDALFVKARPAFILAGADAVPPHPAMVGFRSVATVPLISDDMVLGAVVLLARERVLFDDGATRTLTAIGKEAGGLIARRRAEEQILAGAKRLRRALEETIMAMGALVEMRDLYTAGHERRVTELATAIARHMGLRAEIIEGLRLASDVHDIGKIGVPAEILAKPGRLTPAEFEIIKMHPQIGHDVLSSIEFEWPIAQIVLSHHERLDGSGYPLGLSGNEVRLEGRILAVADVVEAMASHRPYRQAQGMEAALNEVQRNRGRLYDPQAVDACAAVIAAGFDFTI